MESASRLVLVSPANEVQCPRERSGHRILVDDGALYVLGGYNPDVVDSDVEDEELLNERIFVQMWKFNFFTKQWREIQMTGDSPRFLASHTATLHGNTLFTFGGSGIPFGIMSSQDVHVCHLEPSTHTVEWRRLKVSGDIPEKKYGHCQLYQWPYFYIVGGTTGYIYNMDVHRLDLRNCEWKCLWDSVENHDDSPVGRYRHEMVLYNDQMLVFGGGQARTAFTLQQVPFFSLITERWGTYNTVPDAAVPEGESNGFPADRRCHSCVLHKDDVFIYGGRDSDPFGDVWRLSLRTLEWTCLVLNSSSPCQRFFHGADVTSSGCMYIFGGVTKTPSGVEVRTNDICRMVLVVQSLQELSWTVIRDCITLPYSPSLVSDLIDAGVPRTFVQRVVQ